MVEFFTCSHIFTCFRIFLSCSNGLIHSSLFFFVSFFLLFACESWIWEQYIRIPRNNIFQTQRIHKSSSVPESITSDLLDRSIHRAFPGDSPVLHQYSHLRHHVFQHYPPQCSHRTKSDISTIRSSRTRPHPDQLSYLQFSNSQRDNTYITIARTAIDFRKP